ncbi:phage tail P2-like protein [Fusobacterium naviforme]|nr:phage tail P2-like protein [Fusobacterium naviforme]STO27678.1 Bacteriophage P2-related tail formation protein [Fusobacterium naviforme]
MNNAMIVENMLASLPSVLREDRRMYSLATAAAKAFADIDEKLQGLIVYANLDNISEELCDILAKDLAVEWYDYDFSLSDKRNLIKTAINVHRHIGTVGAVEAGISAVYEDSYVEEWFNYSGLPYHFKVLIDSTYQGTDQAKYNSVMTSLNIYKNLRSVLDAVEYYDTGSAANVYANAFCSACSFTDSCVATYV